MRGDLFSRFLLTMSEPTTFVRPHRHRFPCMVAAVLFLGLAAIWVFIALRDARDALHRSVCKNNMHAIVMALHSYHDEYGSFPPAYLADERGRPMHSWRVLVLPHIGHDSRYRQFYERYDFSEPWNGPHNSELARQFGTPQVFQCPADSGLSRDGGGADTSFAAIVGPHTCWTGATPFTIHNITDGPSNTLLVVESHGSGIQWLEPRDLHVLQMATTINHTGGQGIASSHLGRGGAEVGFADGTGRFLSENIDAAALRRLIERDDGEPLDAW
jgi:hypothetical protein